MLSCGNLPLSKLNNLVGLANLIKYNRCMAAESITKFDQALHCLLQLSSRVEQSEGDRSPEHMRRLMSHLGNPQDRLKVIHVAGTSGKTSTSYFIASLLHEAGKKVGLTVSPHIHNLNERVQIDLQPLPEEQYCADLNTFLSIVEQSQIAPSYFELLVAYAYWQFARHNVDYAVVEVGVGGLLDPTNVAQLPSKLCVITDIGLDHQRLLGDTLPEISAQKAGIIQMHNQAVVRSQSAEIMAPIRQRAAQKQAELNIISDEGLPPIFDFLPMYQKRNFNLAMQAFEVLAERDSIARLGDGALLRAARVHVPGRMEIHRIGSKTLIIDAAHNPQKLRTLAASLTQRFPGQEIAGLVALKSGEPEKLEAVTREFAKMFQHIIVTGYGQPGPVPYSADPAIVAALCKIHGKHEVEACQTAIHAWHQLLRRPEPVLVITGSVYLFNEIYPLLSDHAWV
jgi:dihydrofolate synthase / folylpolyglutamate synthase